MKREDIVNLKNEKDYENFYDQKKSEGYDYIEVPQDANNIVVLNNDALQYKAKHFNKDFINPKEQSKPTQEVKTDAKSEVTKLEAERDAEIDKVSKPEFKLELLENNNPLLDKLTGKERTKVTSKGRSIKAPEKYKDLHNDLNKRVIALNALINCK